MWEPEKEIRKLNRPFRRWILNTIDKIWTRDDMTSPSFPKWFIRFYRWCGGIIFNKFTFPMVGTWDTLIYKSEYDGLWYKKYIKWNPLIWPELNTEDILNVQPMTGPCGLKFEMKIIT
jgi:hypothetical protein